MSRLVEASGAQVLPNVRDVRATVSTFSAVACCSADQRMKSPAHEDLAGRLRVIA